MTLKALFEMVASNVVGIGNFVGKQVKTGHFISDLSNSFEVNEIFF